MKKENLKTGLYVLAPEPKTKDEHSEPFYGKVISIQKNKATIQDPHGDLWDFSIYRLKLDDAEGDALLRALLEETGTKAKHWESLDGPDSGAGEERWYRNIKTNEEAYICYDQGEIIDLDVYKGQE